MVPLLLLGCVAFFLHLPLWAVLLSPSSPFPHLGGASLSSFKVVLFSPPPFGVVLLLFLVVLFSCPSVGGAAFTLLLGGAFLHSFEWRCFHRLLVWGGAAFTLGWCCFHLCILLGKQFQLNDRI